MVAALLVLGLSAPAQFTVSPGFVVVAGTLPAKPPAPILVAPIVKLPVTTPAPAGWSRVDSRGFTWTHADRAYLDTYVDGVERTYAVARVRQAVPVPAYSAASSCANGQCAAPTRRRGLFGR